MSDGHVKDPQLNDYKDFGFLLWDQCKEDGPGKDLKCRMLIYLKDKVSRNYTVDTPVTFKVVTKTINGCKVQVATNVREDPDRIDNHPLIKGLNEFVADNLSKYLRWVKKGGNSRKK